MMIAQVAQARRCADDKKPQAREAHAVSGTADGGAVLFVEHLADGGGQVFSDELGDIGVGTDTLHVVFIGLARQRGVDHHRYLAETGILLDQSGQREAVHLRHFQIGQHQRHLVVDRHAFGLGLLCDHLQAFPGFLARLGHDERRAHGLQALLDQAARDDGIVGGQDDGARFHLQFRADGFRIDVLAFARHHLAQDGFHVQHLGQAGVVDVPSRRAMLVTMPPAVPSAVSTWLQSRRTISSTDSTAKACVVRANSVTSMMFRPVLGLTPTMAGKSSTVMIWPRRLTTPSICGEEPATAVTSGMATISRILKTLMPYSSECSPFSSAPRRNNSSSNLLELVKLLRSSTSC